MKKKWIEIDLEENYVIYADNPKKKIPIKGGSIILNIQAGKMFVKFEEMRVKRLKCEDCGFVMAENRLDSRFYCPKCGRNLGSREGKK